MTNINQFWKPPTRKRTPSKPWQRIEIFEQGQSAHDMGLREFENPYSYASTRDGEERASWWIMGFRAAAKASIKGETK